jgi:hypothetical protein
MKINPGKSLTMSGEACAMAIAPHHENGDRVFYYSIFPNMLLSMHPDYVMVHQLWPQSPERTLILCDWFFHPEAFDRDVFRLSLEGKHGPHGQLELSVYSRGELRGEVLLAEYDPHGGWIEWLYPQARF